MKTYSSKKLKEVYAHCLSVYNGSSACAGRECEYHTDQEDHTGCYWRKKVTHQLPKDWPAYVFEVKDNTEENNAL